jgi:hypothetical protein
MTDLQMFTDMLTRAGIGHGLQHDYDPPGTSVQVEEDNAEMVADFNFDSDGTLKSVICYEHEEG